ncbi:MAG: bestrophin family ion channel, partial [Bacteroidota bacterium]
KVTNKANTCTGIIHLQSQELKKLRSLDLIDDFRHVEMGKILTEFYTLQGKSERIKNFPLPRQYATVSFYFVWLFILLLPYTFIGAFASLGTNYIWLTIPSTVIVAWVFYTMERIGDYSENPFEGTVNDVPITSLSRTIEIDLREMLNEMDIPQAITPVDDVLT